MSNLSVAFAPTYGFVIGCELLMMPDMSVGGILFHLGFLSIGIEGPRFAALADREFFG